MNLRIFKLVLDYIVQIITFGVMGIAVGGLMLIFVFPQEISAETVFVLIGSGFSFGAGVFVAVVIIRRLRVVGIRSKKEKYLSKNGYCGEYFNKIESKISKKSGDKKVVKQLFYARELCDGRFFDKALEVMLGLDMKQTAEKLLYDYYSVYFYILVMMGDLENAQVLWGAGEDYIRKTPLGKFSYGVFCYSKEDFLKAEENFKFARKKAKNRYTIHIARLFLALVYVKTDRKELAKNEAASLCFEISNPVLREDLKKLMVIIEKEYGFEENLEKVALEPCEEKGENVEDYAGNAD